MTLREEIRPFRIDIPQDRIDDLHRRLAHTRWPGESAAGWEKGTPVSYLRALAQYWRDGFDWRAIESDLTEDRAKLEVLTGAESFTHYGYAAVQSGRPGTLAVAMHDSPAGLLAWIADMYHRWTDPAITLPEDAVGRDALLTDVRLYWFTGCFSSSIRLYGEGEAWGAAPGPSGVPTAAAVFPGDTSIRAIAERRHTIVRWTEYDRGGHFAALEAPDLLVDDIRAFFRSLR